MGINFHSKKNEILVGLIGNCNDCHHDGNNSGVGQIYRLHPGTGTLVAGNNPGSMGTIRAFNLRVGVVETSDTGFVAVSARRNVNPFVPPTNQELGTFTLCTQMLSTDPANVSPYTSGYYGYWDSDPLIVKFDKNGTKIWEWSEDVVPGRARQAPPIDIKRQECMYKVSEAEDGGYVISGNASSYRDDFYMMKLYPECGALHTYATGMTISSNYTLSTSWDFKGVTTVNSGAVLTITGPTTKIRFADSRHTGVPTYIQVKPGGKLEILNGAELSSIDNSCPGSMWDGIAVLGTSTLNQASSGGTIIHNQGFLVINTATISNARCAITTGTNNANGSFNWSTTGGVIWATAADFINNGRDVQYLMYQSPSGPQVPNAGIFNKCRFRTNNALNDGSPPMGRVSIFGVNGVKFRGCEFSYNAGNAYTPTEHGYGILSVDASYDISDFCPGCGTPTQTAFSNLSRGIAVYNSWTNRTVNVDHAIFTSTYTGATDPVGGILMEGVQGANIKRCTFDFADNFSEGVFLDHCKYYTVTSNTFVGNGGGIGVFASQSQGGSHKIYRNNFQDHYIGILPQFENSSYYSNIGPPGFEDDGLKMNCNTFSGTNDFNIAMTGYSVTGHYPCVARNQGILTVPSNPGLSNPQRLVRNRYAATCGNGNQWHITAGESVKNIQHAANNDSDNRPIPQPSCSNTLINIYNSTQNFSFAAQCTETVAIPVSNPTCPCNNCCRLADINQGLSSALASRATWISEYNNSIDGGYTEYLLDEIASGTLSSTDLTNLIKQYDPYLSDDVLSAFFSNTVVTADDAIYIHNENRPVTPAIWTIIEGRGFPGNKMDILIENQNIDAVSERQVLEDQVSFAKSEVTYVYAQKVNYYITDTLEGARDTLINLLATNVGDLPDAVTQRVDAYAYGGYYTRAQAYADSLADIPQYEEIATLQLALLELATSDNYVYTILDDENLRQVIEEYAADSTKAGCYQARAVLRQVYGNDVFIFRLYPNVDEGRAATTQTEVNSDTDISINKINLRENGLELFPNPAKDGFTLRYNKETAGEVYFAVRDILGKNILEGRLQPSSDFNISVDMFNNGIYFVTLIEDGKTVGKQKLVVMK